MPIETQVPIRHEVEFIHTGKMVASFYHSRNYLPSSDMLYLTRVRLDKKWHLQLQLLSPHSVALTEGKSVYTIL